MHRKDEFVLPLTWLEGDDQDDPHVQRGGHLHVRSLLSPLKKEKIENLIFTSVSANSELVTGSIEQSYRGGILGHHFNKRLESFAPCN
jgi:hypothetical protein